MERRAILKAATKLTRSGSTSAVSAAYCPNFRSDATFLPTLLTQRADTADLLADAEARGWGEEAARHRRLIDRLDKLVAESGGEEGVESA